MKLSSIVKYFPGIFINRKAGAMFPAILIMLLLASTPLSAQENSQKPSRSVALDAWDRGNYETAYEHFNGLLLLYSRDPLYKYYTGACLVNMQRDIPRAIELLGSAINSSVKVKSVPDDVWFWYGRALQMNGDFSQAADAFDRFTRDAGRRMAQEYSVQTFIDQCEEGKGAIGVESVTLGRGQVAQSREQRAESAEQVTSASGRTSWDVEHGASASGRTSGGLEQGARSTEQGAGSMEHTATIEEEKQAVRETANDDVPREYDAILAEAVRIQHQADSLAVIADGAREDLEDAAPESAEDQRQRTELMERRASDRQEEADNLFTMLEDKDTQPPVQQEEKEQPQRVKVLSQFEVRSSQVYSRNNPVPIDISLPEGLVYTIQIAAFKNPPDPALFRGLFPVYGKLKQETGITFYYTGLFRSIEDARQALPGARQAGFPDAFIIALMDDTRVSMERAAILEDEWSGQSLSDDTEGNEEATNTLHSDTMPVGTLAFRAEVMRLDTSPKPELIEKLTSLAGARGLDIIKNNNDETVFLIGNFITFDSADDYVSLLIRNGYSSARVAAYVGKYEIPVEAAKELIKSLPDD